MGVQTVPDLKEMFRQAAEIAGKLPENMQIAGFNRAVDLLSAAMGLETEPARAGSSTSKRTVSQNASRAGDAAGVSGAAELIDAIDSTRHPGVRTATKVLDRALMVLQIALREHGVDGLYPADIARILTNKFRLGTKDAAVRMSLGTATNLVNRVKVGKGFVYKIMGPGEEYLAHLGEADQPAAVKTSSAARRNLGKKRERSHAQVTSPVTKSPPAKRESKGRPKGQTTKGSLGPKSAIMSLVEAGYFDSGRTGPAVQSHLRTKRGFALAAAPLRVAMLRMVRDGILERSENDEGHYEYKKS